MSSSVVQVLLFGFKPRFHIVFPSESEEGGSLTHYQILSEPLQCSSL